MRIGHGYDAHRFCEEKPFVLGGVMFDVPYGLLAHSDGDVLAHAITDALLGAAGKRDIGYYFPDTDGEYKDIDSCVLLERAVKMIRTDGLEIDYIDATVVAQKPKMAPYIDAMRKKLASVLSLSVDRVNVKATTEERMGFTGREEGISAHAVCLLKEESK